MSETSTCWPIKNECWGIAALASGNVVVGCGTGIEDCNSFDSGTTQRTQCDAGDPITGVDTRNNTVPYRVATWRSLTIEVDSDGNVAWQRVDAYKGEGETNPEQHGSSASEYVFVKSDGKLAFVQDEVAGVGIFVIESSSSTPVTQAPDVTEAPGVTDSPTDDPTDNPTPVTEAPDTPGVTDSPTDDPTDNDDDDEDNSSSSDDDDDNKMLFLAVGISVGVLVVLAVMYFVCCRSMMKN